MLPKEFSGDKEAWRRKWRARRKQIEAQEGQGVAAEPADPAPDEGEVGAREAGSDNA